LWLRDFTKRYGDSGPPIHAEAFGVTLEGMVSNEYVDMWKDISDVAGLHFLLAKIDGIRIGGGFRLGGRLGAWLAFVTFDRDRADEPIPAPGQMAPKDTNYRSSAVTIGDGGVWLEHDLAGSLVGKIAAEAKSDAAWNGRMMVDERATASIDGELGKLSAKLAASIAYTQMISARDRTGFGNGGMSFEASYGLVDGVDLRARIEAGRTVYGPNATFDSPTWGTQGSIMLAGHLEHGPH
jgi:hypothetical protein